MRAAVEAMRAQLELLREKSTVQKELVKKVVPRIYFIPTCSETRGWSPEKAGVDGSQGRVPSGDHAPRSATDPSSGEVGRGGRSSGC